MKTKVFVFIALSMLMACGGNKQAQLEKLKKQHDAIAQKIEKLEKEIAASSDSTAKNNTGTFVSVEDIQFQPFNHYIEVQGKLDGDENLAVYPESMGVVTRCYSTCGPACQAQARQWRRLMMPLTRNS